ncbi:hypothetical protein CLOM_g12472 [Closterium sp. NIES-68]|nr:hypothetical protein CLOM_g12472 [Closterium sp. NIES-68]GJP81660.1 hypothetical protein CLOP_g11804 [Closterium sp. NIES-67]
MELVGTLSRPIASQPQPLFGRARIYSQRDQNGPLSVAAVITGSSSPIVTSLEKGNTSSIKSSTSAISAKAALLQSESGAIAGRPSSPIQEHASSFNVPGVDEGLIWTEGGSEQLGALLEGGSVYRERFVIRCYEVGVHKTASIETIANLLQEVGTNHAHSVGYSKDGLATTPGMKRHSLIWATTRIHIEMYKYPTWGDVVEIDTWCQLESNILTRRDWIIRLSNSGEVIGRGTSSWVMMNSNTRRLARIPPDVWEEIISHCPEPSLFALPPDAVDKLPKLKEPADHSKSSLCARRSDLDMNQHVNNVTYIAWMLESLPQDLVDSSELAQISIEYRRECSQNDMVETLASQTAPAAKAEAIKQCTTTDGVLLSKDSAESKGVCLLTLVERERPEELQHYSHVLRLQDSKKEINKGHTIWRKRS